MEFNKEERRQLRELFGYLYESQLTEATRELAKSFDEWNDDKNTVWDVNEKIHEYHNGISQQLFSTYSTSSTEKISMFLRGAIIFKTINIETLPKHFAGIIDKLGK